MRTYYARIEINGRTVNFSIQSEEGKKAVREFLEKNYTLIELL